MSVLSVSLAKLVWSAGKNFSVRAVPRVYCNASVRRRLSKIMYSKLRLLDMLRLLEKSLMPMFELYNGLVTVVLPAAVKLSSIWS